MRSLKAFMFRCRTDETTDAVVTLSILVALFFYGIWYGASHVYYKHVLSTRCPESLKSRNQIRAIEAGRIP
jgi:hypothetical protein